MLAVRRELVAPDIFCAVEAAARREFPFGLGRQFLASPLGIGRRILIGHMHDRMVGQLLDRARRTARMAPVGAANIDPPIVVVAEIDRASRLLEHRRGWGKLIGQCAGIIGRIDRLLGQRDVAGRRNKTLEVAVGDGECFHPEAVDRDAVRRRFFRIVTVRTHQERAAGNPDHSGKRRLVFSGVTLFENGAVGHRVILNMAWRTIFIIAGSAFYALLILLLAQWGRRSDF